MLGRWIAAAFGFAVASAPVWADDGPQTGQFYLSGLASYYYLPENQGYEGKRAGFGLGLGWAFHDGWAAELDWTRFNNADVDLPGGQTQPDRIDNVMLNAFYKIQGSKLPFSPYVVLGAGRSAFNKDIYGSDDEWAFNFGAGAYKDLSDRFSLRADVRGMYVPGKGDDLTPIGTLAVVMKLGSLAPKAEPDADGDGVPDSRDKCPGTPAGRKVDANGCELDSDGDGVVDALDACPNTPPGTKVDSRGCPPPAPPPAPAPVKEPVRFDLTVEFAFNSAEINDLSFRELRNAMQFLRDHPSTHAVIEGHTDNRGTDAYNQKLSERRAAAVVDVLAKSGIDKGRLSSVGYGESRPIASNDTDEGRQKNRRVSIVVSE